MKTFKESMREDLNMFSEMADNGWTPEFSYEDTYNERTTPEHPPVFSIGYRKGDVHAWHIGLIKSQNWRVADLPESHFINHRWYESLKAIIEKE